MHFVCRFYCVNALGILDKRKQYLNSMIRSTNLEQLALNNWFEHINQKRKYQKFNHKTQKLTPNNNANVKKKEK